MMSDVRVSATDASRGFSALLNRVAAGETIEIERHGDVVAVVVPRRSHSMRGDALLELFERTPRVDDDFAEDVRSLAAITRAPVDPWTS